MIDVTALGELLIDFTPAGRSQQGNPLFEQNPGGAPANVLAAVTRLGKKAALISAVGSDQFGRALTEVIEGLGIDPSGIQVKEDAFTTLAFVHLNAAGDRSFSFARKPGADQCIETDAIDHALIDRCRIFHFGSVSLSAEPACSTTLDAARYAFEHGKLVSYDPNWRPALWNSTEQGIAGMKLGLPYTNILKLSEEELPLLTGRDDLDAGARLLAFGGTERSIIAGSHPVTGIIDGHRPEGLLEFGERRTVLLALVEFHALIVMVLRPAFESRCGIRAHGRKKHRRRQQPSVFHIDKN